MIDFLAALVTRTRPGETRVFAASASSAPRFAEELESDHGWDDRFEPGEVHGDTVQNTAAFPAPDTFRLPPGEIFRRSGGEPTVPGDWAATTDAAMRSGGSSLPSAHSTESPPVGVVSEAGASGSPAWSVRELNCPELQPIAEELGHLASLSSGLLFGKGGVERYNHPNGKRGQLEPHSAYPQPSPAVGSAFLDHVGMFVHPPSTSREACPVEDPLDVASSDEDRQYEARTSEASSPTFRTRQVPTPTSLPGARRAPITRAGVVRPRAARPEGAHAGVDSPGESAPASAGDITVTIGRVEVHGDQDAVGLRCSGPPLERIEPLGLDEFLDERGRAWGSRRWS